MTEYTIASGATLTFPPLGGATIATAHTIVELTAIDVALFVGAASATSSTGIPSEEGKGSNRVPRPGREPNAPPDSEKGDRVRAGGAPFVGFMQLEGAEAYLKLGLYLAYQGAARIALRSAVERAPSEGARQLLLEQARCVHDMATGVLAKLEQTSQQWKKPPTMAVDREP